MRRPIVLLLAFLVVTCGLGAVLYSTMLLRGNLTGSMSHDFGEVIVLGKPTTLEHTFHLVNRTNTTVSIQAIVPDCGCTKAEPSSKTVEPGATVDIKTVTEFSARGFKRIRLRVVYDDGSVQMMRVEATGRFVRPTMPPPDEPNAVMRWMPAPPRKEINFDGPPTTAPATQPTTMPATFPDIVPGTSPATVPASAPASAPAG